MKKKEFKEKHGFIFKTGLGEECEDEHMYDTFDRMASRDPNFKENLDAGRYMPRCNGMRVTYRGKDKWIPIKNDIITGVFYVIILGLSLYSLLFFATKMFGV